MLETMRDLGQENAVPAIIGLILTVAAGVYTFLKPWVDAKTEAQKKRTIPALVVSFFTGMVLALLWFFVIPMRASIGKVEQCVQQIWDTQKNRISAGQVACESIRKTIGDRLLCSARSLRNEDLGGTEFSIPPKDGNYDRALRILLEDHAPHIKKDHRDLQGFIDYGRPLYSGDANNQLFENLEEVEKRLQEQVKLLDSLRTQTNVNAVAKNLPSIQNKLVIELEQLGHTLLKPNNK